MKRIILTLFLLLIVITPFQVRALSVSKNNLTVEKGKSETIDLYAEVDTEITEVNFTLVYTSYDVPAYFNIASGLRDEVSGINHKIVFSVPVTGKIKLGTVRVDAVSNPKTTSGVVNIHTAKATTSTGETVSLNTQIVNVTINSNTGTTNPNTTTETPAAKTEESKNLLEKIESELVTIDLQEDVYEYTVKVKESVKELDLKPVTKDEKYKVEITTQKISELKDNQITIKVSNGNNTEEYKIKVNIIKEKEEITIDEEEFESTFKYKGKWVVLIIIFSITLFAGLLLTKKQ